MVEPMNSITAITIRMEGSKAHLSVMFTYLALGILYAIKKGVVPPSVGISTVGRPNFWELLKDEINAPMELIQVLQTADELDALAQLVPEKFDSELDALIHELENVLSGIPNPIWNIQIQTVDATGKVDN